MLMRNQKSKMAYHVKQLKEYFDKRSDELKNALDVNTWLQSQQGHLKFRRYFSQAVQVELWTFARPC